MADQLDMWEALNVAILKVLPDEGAMQGKYVPLTMSSRAVAVALDDSEVSPARIGRRLTAMHKDGLVVTHGGGSEGRNAWQRTAKGKEYALRNGGE